MVDDRIEREDDEVIESLKKILGDEYGSSIERTNAFPNGYASYTLTIEK